MEDMRLRRYCVMMLKIFDSIRKMGIFLYLKES